MMKHIHLNNVLDKPRMYAIVEVTKENKMAKKEIAKYIVVALVAILFLIALVGGQVFSETSSRGTPNKEKKLDKGELEKELKLWDRDNLSDEEWEKIHESINNK